jgi:WD40 repeat protein
MDVATNGTRGVSVGADKAVIVWDLTQGTVIARHDLPVPARSVDLSDDGQRILTGLFDGAVVLWDAESGAELQRFNGHSGIVTRAIFDPAEQRVLSASLDRSLRLWDLESGDELLTIDTPGALLNAAFSPDGTRVVSSSADETSADDSTDAIDRTIRVWDLETGEQVQLFEPNSGFVRAKFIYTDAVRARCWRCSPHDSIHVSNALRFRSCPNHLPKAPPARPRAFRVAFCASSRLRSVSLSAVSRRCNADELLELPIEVCEVAEASIQRDAQHFLVAAAQVHHRGLNTTLDQVIEETLAGVRLKRAAQRRA